MYQPIENRIDFLRDGNYRKSILVRIKVFAQQIHQGEAPLKVVRHAQLHNEEKSITTHPSVLSCDPTAVIDFGL